MHIHIGTRRIFRNYRPICTYCSTKGQGSHCLEDGNILTLRFLLRQKTCPSETSINRAFRQKPDLTATNYRFVSDKLPICQRQAPTLSATNPYLILYLHLLLRILFTSNFASSVYYLTIHIPCFRTVFSVHEVSSRNVKGGVPPVERRYFIDKNRRKRQKQESPQVFLTQGLLSKSGGRLLSHIALQYHRRRRA